MKREDLKELHNIAPIGNIPLIIKHGILSFNDPKRKNSTSIALEAVQEKRAKKIVPNGLPLHDYANLYICARNPMMYKRRHLELVVVRVNTDVLDLPNVVITDGNAASDYTKFSPSPSGLMKVNHGSVFAESWNDDDPIQKFIKAREKCAEVLVPKKVEPHFIIGFYVPDDALKEKLIQITGERSVTVEAHLFFRG